MPHRDQAEPEDAGRRFQEAMAGLLRFMAAQRKPAAPGGPRILAECRFSGQSYDIRFFYRRGGIRPFLAHMLEPWPHKAYLGRLPKDGDPHVFQEGVAVFLGFLEQEEVLEAFLPHLESAVAEWAALRAGEPCSCANAACGKPGCADPEAPPRHAPNVLH